MKRLLSSLLALLMLCTLAASLFSCTSPTSGDPKNTSEVTGGGETGPAETSRYDKSDLPDSFDLDGYLFRFAVEPDPLSINMLFPEEILSEPVNDAMYSRNESVSQKYNFTVENNNIPIDTVKQCIIANDDLYDCMSLFVTRAVYFLLDSYTVDVNTVDNLNLTKNYWDQNFNEQMSIGNALYYMTGALSVADDDKMMVIMYNRDMGDDYGIENLYDAAYAGNWTYDLMAKYAKQVASDLNQDNVIDEDDVIGFMYASNNMLAPHFAACGAKLCEKDDFDIPGIIDNTEDFIGICDMLSPIFDESIAFDWLKIGDSTVQVAGIQSLVNTKHVLFQNMILSQLRRLYRDVEAGFGILPMPKPDETQSKYSTSIYAFDVLAIPSPNAHLAETGFILEALAAASENVTNAYYNICLESKFVRDTESFDMINMMRENVNYDLAYYCDFGGLFSAVTSSFNSNKNADNMASAIASKRSAAEAAVERFVAFIDAF